MKPKYILKLTERLLKFLGVDSVDRGDMYMPAKLLAMSAIFFFGGIGLGVYAAFCLSSWVWYIVAVAIALLGVSAFLCWRNQNITILSDEEFIHTNMFGKKQVYRFADIKGVRYNADSMVLMVGKRGIFIDAMAVLSHRLVDNINAALGQKK